jgi:hypothetical protein
LLALFICPFTFHQSNEGSEVYSAPSIASTDILWSISAGDRLGKRLMVMDARGRCKGKDRQPDPIRDIKFKVLDLNDDIN